MTQPGWYRDPAGAAPLRYWDGGRWTEWSSDGDHVWSARLGEGRAGGPADGGPAETVRHLYYVDRVFLVEAVRRGVLGPDAVAQLHGLTADLRAEAAAPAGVSAVVGAGVVTGEPAVDVTSPGAPAVPLVVPPVVPQVAPQVAPQAVPGGPLPDVTPVGFSWSAGRPDRRTGRAGRQGGAGTDRPEGWWVRVRDRLGSDVAVHGLAYLDVLLLFVGVFGLVAFAFGDVTPALRPVAELVSAAVPFVAAWLLLRRGAEVAGRAMETVGGLILPVMVVTSVVDGFPVPPDLRGAALPTGVALACAVLVAGYVLRVRRHPASGLRFAVAPVVWFLVAMVTIGVGRPVPTGEAVAVPTGWQVAAMAAAVLATTALARRTRGVLGDATLVAAVPGTVVVAALALVTGAAEGWPVLPMLLTAAAVVPTWWLCPRVPAATADVAAVVWWLLVAARVATDVDRVGPVVAVLVLAALVGLVEVTGRRAVAPAAPVLAGLAVPVLLLSLVPARAWAVPAAGLLAVWAAVRRAHPFAVPGAARGLDVLAALLPVVLVLAVDAGDRPWGALPVAGAVVLAAVVAARTPALRRGAADRFWSVWALLAGGAGTLAALTATVDPGWERADTALRLGVPVTLALLAGAAALLPVRPWIRAVVATPLAWAGWLVVAGVLGTGPDLVTVVPAVAGLVLVVLAHAPALRGTDRAPHAADPTAEVPADRAAWVAAGIAGHVTGLLAAGLAAALATAAALPGATLTGGAGGAAEGALGLLVALAALTTGAAVTAVLADRGRSPVGDALDRADATLAHTPWLLVLLGLPSTAWAAVRLVGAEGPSRAPRPRSPWP